LTKKFDTVIETIKIYMKDTVHKNILTLLMMIVPTTEITNSSNTVHKAAKTAACPNPFPEPPSVVLW
jgi:hypothetical protein